MEYKVNVGQGKVVWYKLKNGNDVPVTVSNTINWSLGLFSLTFKTNLR